MNNDCQEYDFSMKFLLLSCNKLFHFCSKDMHIMFLLILVDCNRFNKGEINEVRIE